MANLLDIDQLLELGYSVPNSNDVAVIERINTIITNNEKSVLESIFGISLTSIIYSELEIATPTTRALKLWDGDVIQNERYEGIRKLLANIIYFLMIEDRIVYISASGIMSSVSENSEKVNPNFILNRYFNEYVRIRNNTYMYMNISTEWIEWDSQYFKSISTRSEYYF